MGASETNHKYYQQFVTRNIGAATFYQKDSAIPTTLPGDDLKNAAALPKKSKKPAPLPPTPIMPSVLLPPVTPVVPPSRSPAPEEPPQTSPHQAPTPAEIYQAGLDLYAQGQFEEATGQYMAAIETDPNMVMAYHQMARIRANQGRLEEAQSWCQLALDRAPELLEAHYTLALIFIEENIPDQAIRQFKKVLYLDPNYILAHFGLGNLYQKNDQPEKASRHFAWAIRLAGRMTPEQVVPGSDVLTADQLINMINTTRRFNSG